ncbi:sensor histidine kinase [Chitiniphilus purpureus]|uniref:Oxygen sensor histidine kinase NreB n=1 Tax=Chitiniphilus purpureus TaxID=2981137 RepID=A0ABY6DHD8_9NEIS|nr:sensor histidine kinase [Chitiniphilus sp. CD1]UXY13759.1 sensor histidine kinase [Chitiniphilus sp. CD1]
MPTPFTPPSDPLDPGASAHAWRNLYRAAEARAARLRLLVEAGHALGLPGDLPQLLGRALDHALAFSALDGGLVLLGTPGAREWQVGATRNASLAVSLPVLAPLLPAAQPLQSQDVLAGMLGDGPGAMLPVLLQLPLTTAESVPLGQLVLFSRTPRHRLETEDMAALRLLADSIAATVQRDRLLERLAERERQLAQLVEQLIDAQEAERRRVAHDLHDGLAQVAAAAHQRLQAFAERHAPRDKDARGALEITLGLTQRAVQEARSLISGLRPTVLDDFGLAHALRGEAEQLFSEGWPVSFEERLTQPRLPPVLETALFRIAQEALSNVRKHAGPCQVAVSLASVPGSVHLVIMDNGIGFDPQAARAHSCVGLSAMQERCALLGGALTLESQPGRGTRLSASLPLKEQ